MAQVTCAQCQARLIVPELQAKRGKCPKCGGFISGHAALRSDDARPASFTAANEGPLPLAEESAGTPPKPARTDHAGQDKPNYRRKKQYDKRMVRKREACGETA